MFDRDWQLVRDRMREREHEASVARAARLAREGEERRPGVLSRLWSLLAGVGRRAEGGTAPGPCEQPGLVHRPWRDATRQRS